MRLKPPRLESITIRVIFFLTLIAVNPFCLMTASHASPGVIAYVSSSTNNQKIRLVKPDGSENRLFWQVPKAVAADDGIGALNWNPNGTELLFDSGHNWQRSMAIRDLYAVSADGKRIRRVTSPPGPEGFASYPNGKVTFVLHSYAEGDVQVYVEGAPDPIRFVAKLGTNYRITVPAVADWGQGVRQYIRLWDPDMHGFDSPCNFSEVGWVDVKPGRQNDLGVIDYGVVPYVCPRMFSASWSYDGSRIVYMRRDITTSIDPVNNIWETTAQSPNGGIGSQLLDWNNYAETDKLYRVVLAPTKARQDEMLFLQNSALGDVVYWAKTSNAAGFQQLKDSWCPSGSNCDILDIAWLPDGSGFYLAVWEDNYTTGLGAIWRYSAADGSATPILKLPGKPVGKLAVAPDGKAIIFERGLGLNASVDTVAFGPNVQCPCSLWMVNSNGKGLRRLVADGRAPAWSAGLHPGRNPKPRSHSKLLLYSPNGGETFKIGQKVPIHWQLPDTPTTAKLSLEWSKDGGKSWLPLKSVENNGSTLWLPTRNAISSGLKLRICLPAKTGAVCDVSDNVFSLLQ